MFNFLKKEHIKNSHKLLSGSLLGGAIYFFLITLAHIFGFKIPILFIYYNVPSYIYQDLIIAFLSFGFGMFLYAGYSGVKQNQILITKYIIIAGVGAILGLISINAFTDFSYFEKEFSLSIKILHFWTETIFVAGYVAWVFILYLSAISSDINKKKDDEKSLNEIKNNEQKEYMKFRAQ